MADTEGSRSTPFLAAAGFLLFVLICNATILCYPTDNDLDEIGWLAQHLTLDRPESLANANYPPGLPVLLRLLTPLIGSLLTAALVCSAAACTAIALLGYRLAMLVCADTRAALATLVLVCVVVFRSATSEFADATAAALLCAGLYVYLSRLESPRHHLMAGALIGLAYVFRYHYLVFALLVPVASIVLCGTTRQMLRRTAVFAGGFLLGALPLLALNTAAYGSPLHTGISPFLVGQHVTGTVDWYDYLATYDLWPLRRLLAEDPWSLVSHLAGNASAIFFRPTVFATVLLWPVLLLETHRDTQPGILAFLGLCIALYLLIVVCPTQVTDRALLPAKVLLCVLFVQGLARAATLIELKPGPCLWLYCAGAVALAGGVPHSFVYVRDKLEAREYNWSIIKALRSAGMTSSAQVLCNDWDLYPLDDPAFVTYYNYGGWMLLDREYAAQRPRPLATTVDEWRDFMRHHNLRFFLFQVAPETRDFTAEPLAPTDWELVHQDDRYVIVKVLPDSP
jgi:hypothetical protein